MSEEQREQLRRMLRSKALAQGDFVLRSGVRSSFYLDARLVTLSPAGLALCARLLLASLPEDIDAVGGPTLGASPLVAGCCQLSSYAWQPLAGFLVRMAAKDHGTGRRIEGPVRPGQRVALVDDTVSTGGALLAAIRASEEEGLEVVAVRVLVDREAGGLLAIARAGYDISAVLTMSEILRHG